MPGFGDFVLILKEVPSGLTIRCSRTIRGNDPPDLLNPMAKHMADNSKAPSHPNHGKNGSGTVGKEFQALAATVSAVVGSKWAFSAALLVIAAWAVLGPYFHYSDTWQLVVNTATTIVTFLMVFLIQNTQNRDARAIHLKLDEIIRSIRHAHNEMIDIEKLSDEELEDLSAHFEEIRAECEQRKQGRIKVQRN